VVVDVREEEQFVLGHIDGAKRISPDSLEESMRDVVPDLATPIVVYCAAGDRCASVADLNASGGMDAHGVLEKNSRGGARHDQPNLATIGRSIRRA
jgi:rhodanese-related sulfurtransferase